MSNSSATIKAPAAAGTVYSDEDRGYILDTLDLPAAQVAAHLGRSVNSVYGMRFLVRKGHVPNPNLPWTSAEDNIVRLGAKRTAAEIAKDLPGRTAGAVKRRRTVLGTQAELKHKDPNKPGNRTLIARTCKQCGLLLPAAWFRLRNAWVGKCKKCESDNAAARPQRSDSAWANMAIFQEISLKTADRNKFDYTSEDEVVLLDENMTVLEKAVALRRTYFAVRAALFVRGIKDFKRLGKKELDQWFIDNPNLDRLPEITASLRDEVLAFGVIHPEWDWED